MTKKRVHSGTLAGTLSTQTPPTNYTAGRKTGRAKGGINLRTVAAVLEEYGMDPTVEIIKILRPVDDEGNAVPSKLDPDVQARILNELLQYTQPKLKSVEVKAKVAATAFDINDAQAKRIAEEFLKASLSDAEDDE